MLIGLGQVTFAALIPAVVGVLFGLFFWKPGSWIDFVAAPVFTIAGVTVAAGRVLDWLGERVGLIVGISLAILPYAIWVGTGLRPPA